MKLSVGTDHFLPQFAAFSAFQRSHGAVRIPAKHFAFPQVVWEKCNRIAKTITIVICSTRDTESFTEAKPSNQVGAEMLGGHLAGPRPSSVLENRLAGMLKFYQAQYPGAMDSGCGGGHLFVASDRSVSGAFRVTIRLAAE